jgi:glc operon protein GlcG
MRSYLAISFAAATALAAVASAEAQQAQQTAPPAPTAIPEKMPFDIPYGTPIGIDAAKAVAAAAEAEAKKHDWKMDIAVVGPGGELIYFEKMDGAQIGSIAVAQLKAHSAASFRRPTKVFQDAINGGNANLLALPGIATSEGGFPLVEGGKLIGAIGCSGGTSAQDGVSCKAGADTIK